MKSISSPGRKAGISAARRASVRGAAGAAAAAVAVAGSLALAGPAFAGVSAHRAATASYTFTTLNNNADPTFNQLLGINSANVISGYFGSGAAGHPNKGYLLNPPYAQANYTSENFPASTQTQVTGLNNLADTSGFWVNATGTNRGFVEWNGVFASFTNPKTPKMPGSVNQLLGINNAGEAVGFYNDAAGHSHPYEVNQATRVYTPVQVPGVSAVATGINNAGDVVGFATDAAGNTTSWLKVDTHLTSFQFPGGTNTQAFGINGKDQIVGSYLDGSGVMHGFVLSDPLGPTSHWQSIDDPNGVGSTVVNGINTAGDLVGFYTDAAGNTDGMLATPAAPQIRHLTLTAMPSATATFGTDGSGNLNVQISGFGFTPGSAHAVDIIGPDGTTTVAQFSTLTADGTGQASATLTSTFTGSIPDGSSLLIHNGNQSSPFVFSEPIAGATLKGVTDGTPIPLTAISVAPGQSFGSPKGTATVSYNPGTQKLTVKVNASGLSPGMHAAHVHLGSCTSQGGVLYMLMDFKANRTGNIVDETRTVTGVTTPIPSSGWYLNLHLGTSNNILQNGQPTIFFRPMLCSNI